MKQRKYRLISLLEIEHWLIYHVPMTSTRLYHWPFSVSYGDETRFYAGAIQETPWQAYREVARFIFKNPKAREHISKLYHYS